jgi:hypothetical protein
MPTSTATVVYSNPAGTMLAHSAGYAEMRYEPGTLRIADLHDLLTRLGELLQQRGWHKVLLNGQHLTGMPDPVKQWAHANWLTPVIARPAELRQATLVPADVFGRLALQELQAGVGTSYHNRNFADEAAAHDYLSNLPVHL